MLTTVEGHTLPGGLYIIENITFAPISISNEGVSVRWIPTIYYQVKDWTLQILIVLQSTHYQDCEVHNFFRVDPILDN